MQVAIVSLWTTIWFGPLTPRDAGALAWEFAVTVTLLLPILALKLTLTPCRMIWLSVDPCPVEVMPAGSVTVGELPKPEPLMVSFALLAPTMIGLGSKLVIAGVTVTGRVGCWNT